MKRIFHFLINESRMNKLEIMVINMMNIDVIIIIKHEIFLLNNLIFTNGHYA